jgi:membrane protein implicated in regulation of membrane protease activity
MKKGILLVIVYVLIVLLPALLALRTGPGGSGFIINLSQNFGLAAFVILILQAVLVFIYHRFIRPWRLSRQPVALHSHDQGGRYEQR